MFEMVVRVAWVDAGRVLGCGSCCEEGMETRIWIVRAKGRPNSVMRFETRILAVAMTVL